MKVLFAALLVLGKTAFGQDTTSIEVVFAGDIMQHESQMKSAYDSRADGYDYAGVFDKVRPILQSADLAIGNLELTLGGKPYTGYPQFSAPDEWLGAIRDAGFDVLVTANNHSVDRGQKGLERTIRLLDSLGLAHTGTFTDTLDFLNEYPLMLTTKGVRLALLNYTYGTNGIAVRPPNIVNRIDTARIREDVDRAKRQNPDAILVFFHWGNEYIQEPTPYQESIAGFCLSMGVKLVIGSHPHVLQPMIWDRDRDNAVVYSLGNFISGQRVRYRNGGALVHVTLQRIADRHGVNRTKLMEVSYSLAWVHRATNKARSFELLPIDAQVDTTAVSSPGSRALLKEFVDDSRAFLDRENRFVAERARMKKDD